MLSQEQRAVCYESKASAQKEQIYANKKIRLRPWRLYLTSVGDPVPTATQDERRTVAEGQPTLNNHTGVANSVFYR